jgi:hypothetical protein
MLTARPPVRVVLVTVAIIVAQSGWGGKFWIAAMEGNRALLPPDAAPGYRTGYE